MLLFGVLSAQSWGPVVNLSNTANNCSISCHGTQHNIDAVGDVVHVLWAENNRTDYYSGGSVVYRRSTDFGTTWGSIITLMTVTDPPDPPPHGDTIFELGMGPNHTSLCANGNYVHAIWDIDSVWTYYINLGGGDTDTVERHHYWIYYARSTNAGVNWSSPVLLHGVDSVGSAPAIAASGNNVYAIWLDDYDHDQWMDITLRRSTDNGATWGSESRVYEAGDVLPVMWPDIAASGNYVHVIFLKWKLTSIDKMYARSTNAGSSWSTSTLFTSSNTLISFYGYPSIEAAGDYVYAAWDDAYYIRVKRSTDNGATWIPSGSDQALTIDSAMAHGGGWSVSPSIACDPTGQYVHVFWWFRNSTFNGEILYQFSGNYGASWSFPALNASGNTRYWSILPSTAARDTCACVTWSDMDLLVSDADMFYRRVCMPKPLYEGAPEATGALTGLSLIAVPHKGRFEVLFSVPREGFVSLALYDPSGRLVKEAFKDEAPAGYHRATVSTAGLPDGIYYLVLSTSSGTVTAKAPVGVK
ncbi:MAG: hypothetical protein ABIN66_03985 [candidate division WOR-3 bacterium]